MKNVKTYLFSISLLLIPILTGCGGSSGDDNIDINTGGEPTILNLEINPATISAGEGGGSVAVSFSFEFLDDDANVSTFYLYDPETASVVTTLDMDAGGITIGEYVGFITIDTNTAPGLYSFQIYVDDKDGNESNRLTASVLIE